MVPEVLLGLWLHFAKKPAMALCILPSPIAQNLFWERQKQPP
jgi:hypothetical protein